MEIYVYGDGWETTIGYDNDLTISYYGMAPMHFGCRNSLIEAKSIIKSYCPDYSSLRVCF